MEHTKAKAMWPENSRFPVIHKVGNVGIFVQLVMRTNLKRLSVESILIQIYICHNALNQY